MNGVRSDLVLPGRFGLGYDRDGQRNSPIMIHRSIIGTLERMAAHLLEVHDGALPLWLSPTQAIVLPANDESRHYATEVKNRLAADGLRVELEERDATLGARIRAALPRKIPYLVVVGKREQQDNCVSVRLRGGQQLAPVPLNAFATLARRAVNSYARDLDPSR